MPYLEQPPLAEERPKPVVLDQALPTTPADWARYVCPDQARQIFRNNSNPHCINTHSITNKARLHAFPSQFSQCHDHLTSIAGIVSAVFIGSKAQLQKAPTWYQCCSKKLSFVVQVEVHLLICTLQIKML